MAGDAVSAHRHRAGADRDQPRLPHRRPAWSSAAVERRRHGPPRPAVARLDPQNEESEPAGRARAALTAARAQLAEARNNYERFRDLVAESAVSRAQFEQAEAIVKSAAVAGRGRAVAGDARARTALSYTRLVADVAGRRHRRRRGARRSGRRRPHDRRRSRATAGATPCSTCPPRDQGAPRRPAITVALTIRSDGHRARPACARSRRAPIPSRARSACACGLIDPPAAHAPRLHRHRPHEARRRGRDRDSGVGADPHRRQSAVWVVDPKTGTVATRNIEIRSSDPGARRSGVGPRRPVTSW